jgi:hypothetical protein
MSDSLVAMLLAQCAVDPGVRNVLDELMNLGSPGMPEIRLLEASEIPDDQRTTFEAVTPWCWNNGGMIALGYSEPPGHRYAGLHLNPADPMSPLPDVGGVKIIALTKTRVSDP